MSQFSTTEIGNHDSAVPLSDEERDQAQRRYEARRTEAADFVNADPSSVRAIDHLLLHRTGLHDAMIDRLERKLAALELKQNQAPVVVAADEVAETANQMPDPTTTQGKKIRNINHRLNNVERMLAEIRSRLSALERGAAGGRATAGGGAAGGVALVHPPKDDDPALSMEGKKENKAEDLPLQPVTHSNKKRKHEAGDISVAVDRVKERFAELDSEISKVMARVAEIEVTRRRLQGLHADADGDRVARGVGAETMAVDGERTKTEEEI